MTQKGRAGVALFLTTIASFFGGSVGILVLTFLTPLLVRVSMAFGPAEYFAMVLFGVVAAGTIAKGAPIKGLTVVLLGMLFGSVGADLNTAVDRFTFGYPELITEIGLVPVAWVCSVLLKS